MDEPRWFNSAEEYRTIQGLIREGRHSEAVERARRTLLAGQIGRKNAARLHSLICRVYAEEIRQPCPSALLHGEEAVRLAEAVHDPWIKCEALSRLVHAYCHTGDLARAAGACETIAAEVEQNPGVIAGGRAALLLLRATVAAAAEDWPGAVALLDQAEAQTCAEPAEVVMQIYAGKLMALLEAGRYADARTMLKREVTAMGQPESAPLLTHTRCLARAWLALAESDTDGARRLLAELWSQAPDDRHSVPLLQGLALLASLEEPQNPVEAARLARLTHQRSLSMGRVDLARRFRRRFGHLLQVTAATT